MLLLWSRYFILCKARSCRSDLQENICSTFTGEHPCQSMISIEITFRYGCTPKQKHLWAAASVKPYSSQFSHNLTSLVVPGATQKIQKSLHRYVVFNETFHLEKHESITRIQYESKSKRPTKFLIYIPLLSFD